MDTERLDELVSFLTDELGDDLRSVIYYNFDASYNEIVYARDDVLEQYTQETIDQLIQSYEMESAAKMVEEKRYEHGELRCVVRCFDDGTEMNLLQDGEGVAIGLEAGTFATRHSFVGNCMEAAGISNA